VIPACDFLSLLDLTDLSEGVDALRIEALCASASGALGNVASVCVFPQWVQQAKARLSNTSVQVTTVANFPRPDAAADEVCYLIEDVIAQGADEVDVVMPYPLLSQDNALIAKFLDACRKAAKDHVLKIIIESGVLSLAEVSLATELAILSGADFVKTSTGKVTPGATLDAVSCMADTLLANKSSCGIKISGGVRTVEQAQAYYVLLAEKMPASWWRARGLRFGASSLLDDIMQQQG
jgi:deoxyribose-phosphate aldolase